MTRITRGPTPLIVALLVASLAGAPTQAADPTDFEPLDDAAQQVTGIVPAGWGDLGNGLHARQATATDQVVLAIQSTPASRSTLWSSLLPQLGLSVIPESVGTRDSDPFEWTLYEIHVTSVDPALHVDVAIADMAGRSYLVLLLALEAEGAALHDAVFLPVLDALAPRGSGPSAAPTDLPYTSTEVTFPGGAPGVVLAGTLTRPPGDDPVGGVVLLSGSGPQDRDESLQPLADIRPFALIADALTRAGIAVLRFDDRGYGASTGDYSRAQIADLTADGAAAVAFLAGQAGIDAQHVGVLGHSLGGIEAASLGALDAQVAFVVGMAAPAVDGVSLLVAQNVAISESAGVPPETATASVATIRAMYEAARDGAWGAAESALRELIGLTFDGLPPATRAQLGDRDAWVQTQLGAQLLALQSTEFRSILASDPGPDWAHTAVPVLALYGAKDVQVVASQNAPSLTAALDTAGNTDHEVITLPDANHLFQRADTGSVAEYATLEPIFTPDFLPTLVGWVTRHATEAR